MKSFSVKALTLMVILMIIVIAVSCKSKPTKHTEPVITNMIEKDAVDYETIRKEYLGKVLVVNFFASWCPPCRAEAPAFTRVYNEYKDKNFAIVGFSIDEDKSAAIDFVNQYGFKFPVYLSSKAMQKKYNVEKVPTTIIYSKEGEIIEIIPGAMSESFLKSYAKLGSDE